MTIGKIVFVFSLFVILFRDFLEIEVTFQEKNKEEYSSPLPEVRRPGHSDFASYLKKGIALHLK